MEKTGLIILAAIFLFGCVQPPAPTPTPTVAPTVISAHVITPTPVAAPASSNFSNEVGALGEAAADIEIINGKMIATLKEISDARERLAAYSAHLDSLDPESTETVFLKKNIEAAGYFLSSNEHYIAAGNFARARTTGNFSCTQIGVYNMNLKYLSDAVDYGVRGVNVLESLAGDYPSLANETGSELAAKLIKAYYTGMGEEVNDTIAFLKTTCG